MAIDVVVALIVGADAIYCGECGTVVVEVESGEDGKEVRGD
jgi:hypothetical protein